VTIDEATVIDAATVIERADKLIADHGSDSQTAFLGAQFDAGLAWIHFPVGYGGLAVAPKLQELVDERLEAAGRRYPWMRNPMGIGMVGPTLAQHGTDEQRGYLRAIWTAEELWCQLFSEPGAGSDVATLSTRAVRDGDEWITNGQKVWTSLAHAARRGLLLARTDPDVPKHSGLTAFVLDMHAPGVEVRPLRQMSGAAHFNEVYMTDVRIPDSARVGGVGDGWKVAVTTLMNERVSIGGNVQPRGSGPIGTAVRLWQTHGRDASPAHRARLMKLWVEAEVLRLGNMRAQQLREHGTPGPEGSVLKLGSALLSQRIADFSVTLMGASGGLISGYDEADDGDEGSDAVRNLLASQSTTIAGGTSEIMRNILGERMLGLPPEPRADKNLAWSAIPKGA
jgi:alkylation response protein AidB-like acyl-CoA dehydrogenase